MSGKKKNIGGIELSEIKDSNLTFGNIDASVTAGGDIVAGDKIEHHYYYSGAQAEPAPQKPRQPYEPEMLPIPAGPFTMGSDTGEPHEGPAHPVRLPSYQISRYPITNAQYYEYVKQAKVAVSAKAGWELARVGQAPPPAKLDHPLVGLSWDEASAYCAWLREQTGRNYQLPTEAQWEKAARGPEGARAYPWGETFDPARCNNAGSDTTPVGHYSPPGDSPYGCGDLAGNVWEWTRTRWGNDRETPDFRYPYPPPDQSDSRDAPPDNPSLYREYRLCRGGSFADKPERLRCAARARFTADSQHARRGFRVVIEENE